MVEELSELMNKMLPIVAELAPGFFASYKEKIHLRERWNSDEIVVCFRCVLKL